MKTPREILFKRHETAESKLNVIRENVVTEHLMGKGGKERPVRRAFNPAFVVMKLWQELAWPGRRTLAGLAAVWVLIFAFHLSTHDGSRVVADRTPVSKEVIAQVREQRRFYAEMVGLRETRDAEPPRKFMPRPRSEGCCQTVIV